MAERRRNRSDSAPGSRGNAERVIHVGCCGWSYLNPSEFEVALGKAFSSTLQAYAQLLGAVEINSTFYRIPQTATAGRWFRDATDIRPDFVFTVKAFQGITHRDRFGKASTGFHQRQMEVVRALHAPVLLFQSPASYAPTEYNVGMLRSFFGAADRASAAFAWEPRGAWYESPELLGRLCEDLDLVHCVDPLRTPPIVSGATSIAYFRLHGFGKPSMYNYEFSASELESVLSLIEELPLQIRTVYVFFNNTACYRNALEFITLLESIQ